MTKLGTGQFEHQQASEFGIPNFRETFSGLYLGTVAVPDLLQRAVYQVHFEAPWRYYVSAEYRAFCSKLGPFSGRF